MVKIGKRTESGWVSTSRRIGSENIPKETRRSTHLVADDETPLASTLDLEDFHDRAITAFNLPHYLLVDLEGVFAGLFEKDGIRDRADVRKGISARGLGREVTFCDKVAADLLRGGRGNRTGSTERFETVAVGGRCLVEEQGIDPGE